MKRRYLIPVAFTALLLSSCQFLIPSKNSNSNTNTDTSDTSGTSEEKVPVVTKVSLNKISATLKPGGSLELVATVTGENNPDTSVKWTSSNTSVATVTDGVVSVSEGAATGSKFTVTATSVVTPSVQASCSFKVTSSDTYTIMLYVCGSDLESSGGYATKDIKEILSVADQPDNVNIVIQTGGASSWNISNISGSKCERFHVENKQLVKDETLSSISMGASTTLQGFVEYGLKKYSADHMGFIYWNHGGAVNGCCYDENKGDDSILAREADEAFSKAFSNSSFAGKLDWVGYDCCVMSYADLASINSKYFKYMVASQELEAGDGWDYDNWLPLVFDNTAVNIDTLLTKICDTFVADNGGNSSRNDQVLSYLNLTKMDALTAAFEDFAATLSGSNWSTLSSCFNSSLRFGSGFDNGYYDFGLSDMRDFFNKAASSGFETEACLTALNEVAVHSSHAKNYYKTVEPCGLNVFMATSSKLTGMQIDKSNYTASDTAFTKWQALVVANGKFYR